MIQYIRWDSVVDENVYFIKFLKAKRKIIARICCNLCQLSKQRTWLPVMMNLVHILAYYDF